MPEQNSTDGQIGDPIKWAVVSQPSSENLKLADYRYSVSTLDIFSYPSTFLNVAKGETRTEKGWDGNEKGEKPLSLVEANRAFDHCGR